MAGFAYDFEFLKVGSGQRSGDRSHGTIVIDGGDKEAGKNLVAHLKAQGCPSTMSSVVEQ